tara:strand:+ start:22415 stop:23542 length:1128 start_codon:yes stop_codon:yes gene_type:complete
LIQNLDIRNNCFGIFYQNDFIFEKTKIENATKECTSSWTHSPGLNDEERTFLFVVSKGEDISNYMDDSDEYLALCKTLEAQKKAAISAKINLTDTCFFDIIPYKQLKKWFAHRATALKNILSTMEKTEDYDILHKCHVLTTEIAHETLNYGGSTKRVKYDIFGSATGRMTTKKGSFPILNLKKDDRANLKPKNDLYVELDFNGAEIRTLLWFSGKEQPNYDIHEFNKQVFAKNELSRQDVKEKFFAWLYNPNATDQKLQSIYNKQAYEKHYKNGVVTTPFGRMLEVDEKKALNYLIQSTTSDLVMENCYKIMKKLKDKKSFVAFTLHDSVVLDFDRSEVSLVPEIKKIFETTRCGSFVSNCSAGLNFGALKEIKI